MKPRLPLLCVLLLLSAIPAVWAFGSHEKAPVPPETEEAGELVEITGKISIRGNEPFTYTAIETEDAVYRLSGEKAEVLAAEYQQRTVTLRGRIGEGSGMPGFPQLFEVDEILSVQDGELTEKRET